MTNKDDQDNKIWKEAVRDVTPLRSSGEAKAPARQKGKSASVQRREHHAPPPSRKTPPHGGTETDGRTAQRLRRGKIPVEGRLDLHGLTQGEAYDALCAFIPAAWQQGKRCVLVITGKGERKRESNFSLERKAGVLRQKTPQWLTAAPLNDYVLRIETARPQHGGNGAFYVLLRRKR